MTCLILLGTTLGIAVLYRLYCFVRVIFHYSARYCYVIVTHVVIARFHCNSHGLIRVYSHFMVIGVHVLIACDALN